MLADDTWIWTIVLATSRYLVGIFKLPYLVNLWKGQKTFFLWWYYLRGKIFLRGFFVTCIVTQTIYNLGKKLMDKRQNLRERSTSYSPSQKYWD